ncbi:MAG TPA: hypothetical protein VNU24_00935 [Solirubrobacteraceae bacterium]|nr:hypothetical protein [Solirubrobacteraceae bacterium]
MPSTSEFLLAIAAIVALNLLLRATRWLARRPRTIRWAWRNSRPSSLGYRRREMFGDPPRKPLQWLKRCTARAIAWHAERPLRVQPFEGAPDTDPTAVSSSLSSAMTRIASSRRSGVDTVTAPIAAESAIEAIAEGVKAAPAGGGMAAALLRLGAWAVARGTLQLSGHVLAPTVAGPGLALTISTGSGRVLERLTLRAGEFESGTAGGTSSQGNEADRCARVTTAGAVWTHFKILEDEWHLSEDDIRESLRTADWHSYALMRVGAEGNDWRPPQATRALYARAVDADPDNLTAQFNLASAEMEDVELVKVRGAAMRRLELVHDELDGEGRCTKDPQAGAEDAVGQELLLNRDPLHYQVAYKQIAARLNYDVALEVELEAIHPGLRYPRISASAPWLKSRVAQACAAQPAEAYDAVGVLWNLRRSDLERIRDHLCDIERTLIVLGEADSKRFVNASSKQWEQLRALLREIEGPTLVLWAMVALRVGPSDNTQWASESLWLSQAGAPKKRRDLLALIEGGDLTPVKAVAFARGPRVSTTSRTCFSLACWYADIGRLQSALRELALSLECGGEIARRRVSDDQLRALHGRREWATLQARYVSGVDGANTETSTDASLTGQHPATVAAIVNSAKAPPSAADPAQGASGEMEPAPAGEPAPVGEVEPAPAGEPAPVGEVESAPAG